LVDALVSGTSGSFAVQVRVLFRAPSFCRTWHFFIVTGRPITGVRNE